MNITLESDIVSIEIVYFLKQLYTRAQLSQRKPTVAFCPCYWQWQTDEIHIVCDLLKTYSGYSVERGKTRYGLLLNANRYSIGVRSVTLSERGGNNAIVYK